MNTKSDVYTDMANAQQLTYVNSRGRDFKWYPGDRLKCIFWGRISGFDHKAVRAMVRKEPKLIRMKWYTSTPLSWLFNQDRAFFAMTNRPCPRFSRQTENRLPKMLRLLLELGAELPNGPNGPNPQSITPWALRFCSTTRS